MSLYYTHLLIPLSPEYRPEPDSVAAFGQGIIKNGNVASPFTISFAPVKKAGPSARKARNVVTGETISIPLPSRRTEKSQTLASPSQIIEHGAGRQEYDVAISAEGVPAAPPFPVGLVEDGKWAPMVGGYFLEIRCRIRNNIVRLYSLDNEDDLQRPPDFAKFEPRFDEDCSLEEREGIFVHPESGAVRIQNAGCGTFWIEFRLGKLIFPRLNSGGVNLLDDSVVCLAQRAFNCEFVQACDWG
ncbi:MAG TPA: hypothetical protein VGY98_14425 [Verrucomicrobiae bacterium]|nr:hypothetical protein [Verrucomicrobiae bacterium]